MANNIPIKGIQLEDSINDIYILAPSADNVQYSSIHSTATNVKEALEGIYNILYSKPIIECDTMQYVSLGTDIILNFSVQAVGNIQVTVKKEKSSIPIYNENTSNKNFSVVDKNTLSSAGRINYVITVRDSFGNIETATIVVQVMEFKVVAPASMRLVAQQQPGLTSDITLPKLEIITSGLPNEASNGVQLMYSLDASTWMRVPADSKISVNSQPDTGTLHVRAETKIDEETVVFTNTLLFTYFLIEKQYYIQQNNSDQSFNSNNAVKLAYTVLALNTDTNTHQVSLQLSCDGNIKTYVANNIATYVEYAFYIGQLSPGEWQLQWKIDDESVNQAPDRLIIAEGASRATDGLLLEFKAEDFDQESLCWKPSYESDTAKNIYLQFYGRPEKTDATSVEEPSSITAPPQSYAIMQSLDNYDGLSPIERLINDAGEFSIELYYKSTEVGEFTAPVFACASEFKEVNSLAVNYNQIHMSPGQNNDVLNKTVSPNTWQHIVMTLAPADTTKPEKQYGFYKIYLNGCLIGCSRIKDDTTQIFPNHHITLNGYYHNEAIHYSGLSQYNLLRVYNTALTADEVILNYKNAIEHNSTLLQKFQERENNTSIGKIFFLRRPENEKSLHTTKQSDINYSTFQKLHTFTVDNKTESKKTAANCFVRCFQGGVEQTSYPDVDVFLQGTSSLSYPIKNYKIKAYKDELKDNKPDKLKFLPPYAEVDQKTGMGWGGTKGDSTYTLKCDYMEHSHKNNTPTALYYDRVIEALCSDAQGALITDKLSPPRRVINSPYRDSINGFPILVYYYDNIGNETSLEALQAWSESELEGYCTEVGSFMFNVDKSGKALGFEYDDAEQGKTSFDFPIKDYYIESTTNLSLNATSRTLSGEFIFESANTPPENMSEKTYYLYGYNDQYEEVIMGTYSSSSYSETSGVWTIEITTSLQDISNITPLCLSEMKTGIERPAHNYCVSLEGTHNSDDAAAATFYPATPNQDKLKYYSKTLEARHSYSEDWYPDDNQEDTRLCCDYEVLDHCIKFFKIVSRLNKASLSNQQIESLKQRFASLFSYEYCLAHYLQMLVFIQVDNAGKNAMFDSWDGGKIYPRPYDMDTQMGLKNDGKDVIPISAEFQTKEHLGEGTSVHYTNLLDPNVERLDTNTYNTKNSQLWTFMFNYYQKEIADAYKKLREHGVYNADNMLEFVNGYSSDIISEARYNRDAVIKYLTLDATKVDGYLPLIAGNRNDRYLQVAKDRLYFLDSVFEHNKTALEMRLDETGTIDWYISSTTPQYLYIRAGGNDKNPQCIFISPEFEYKLSENDPPNEGLHLALKTGGSDVETSIGPIERIKFIKNLQAGKISDIKNLNQATNLTSFSLSNSSTVTTLNFTNNPLLNDVQISSCSGLSTLNLSSSVYLKTLSLTGCSGLQSLTLPTGAPIITCTLQNLPKLTKLSMKDLKELTTDKLKIQSCPITDLTIDNCSQLTNLDLSTLPSLTTLTLKNLTNLNSLNLSQHQTLTTVNIVNCPNLTEITASRSPIQTLNLSELGDNNQLQVLDVSECSQLTSVAIQPNSTEPAPLQLNIDSCPALIKFNSIEDGVFDFNGLNLQGELHACYNTGLKEIRNLTYMGLGKNLFASCTNLEKITNTKMILLDEVHGVFQDCTSLTDVPKYDPEDPWLTQISAPLDDNEADRRVTSVNYIFNDCYKLDINKIFKLCLEQFVKNNSRLTHIREWLTRCGLLLPEETRLCQIEDEYQITIPANVQNMFMSFNGCNLSSLHWLKFSENSLLTDINQGFASNDFDTIPEGFFNNCTQLKTCNWTFYDCKNLKAPETYTIFSETGIQNLESISHMFYRSPQFDASKWKDLTEYMLQKDSKDGSPICTALNRMDRAFAETGTSSFIDNLFSYLPNVSDAQGAFANCKQLSATLDTNRTLCGSNMTTIARRAPLNLGGIFFDCTELSGVLSSNFFGDLQSYITSLGQGSLPTASWSNDPTYSTLGAFSNTKITGYHKETFQGMTQLQDISYIFAQVKSYTRHQQPNSTLIYYNARPFYKSDGNSRGLYGYYEVDENKSVIQTSYLTPDMFRGAQLRTVRGAFMGTQIEGFPKNIIDEITPQNFGIYPKQQEEYLAGYGISISHFFAECHKLRIDDNIPKIFNQANIWQANQAFAGTIIDTYFETILANFTNNLKETTRMFANCTCINQSLPENIFQSFTQLTYASYMFANVQGITKIEENEPHEMLIGTHTTILLDYSGNEIAKVNFTYDSNTSYWAVTIIDNETQEEYYQCSNLKMSYEGYLMFDTPEEKGCYIDKAIKTVSIEWELDSQDDAIKDGQIYAFYGSNSLDSDAAYLFEAELVIDEQKATVSNLTATNNTLQWIRYIIAIPTQGLFYHNLQLKSADGTFFNTGLTSIPQHPFANPKGYQDLTNISYLFGNCKAYANTDGQALTLIPQDWLLRCPNLESIRGIFVNLGATSYQNSPTGMIANASLGSAFNHLRNLTDASLAFAGIPCITGSVIDGTLLEQAYGRKLNTTAYLFTGTPLQAIITPFIGTAGALKQTSIQDLTASFAHCDVIDENFSISDYDGFLKTANIYQCWTYASQSNTLQNKWPVASFAKFENVTTPADNLALLKNDISNLISKHTYLVKNTINNTPTEEIQLSFWAYQYPKNE